MLGNKELHYRLWDKIVYLLESGYSKVDVKSYAFDIIKNVFDIPDNDASVINKCFACKEANGHCDDCPIRNNIGMCVSLSVNLYTMFCKSMRQKDIDTAIIIAKEIRDAWE